ncbi:MAG: TlpA disulfide reductase family protein [Proteobacteria bacterium]|nr:TlpA disulfide reductase family protein [Pseudomonadota bacterium]
MSYRGFLSAAIVLACAAFPALAAAGDPPPFSGSNRPFIQMAPREAAPDLPFTTRYGDTWRLSQFRGKVVLLNFWATWCPPCVWEMPGLDRLNAALDPEEAVVLAVAIDRKAAFAVRPFFDLYRLKHLDMLFDPADALRAELGALDALPITFLIDRQGRLAGYLPGSAEWDSPDALALIRYYLGEDGE